ncbi:MAG: hypothetical protein HC860_01015 [Alkalinema sp. RU_4_3]|nr:hypothetical protein [Alkalinema sp. RU_4_3]
MSNQISNIEFRFTEEVLAQLRQPALGETEPTAVLDDFLRAKERLRFLPNLSKRLSRMLKW